MKVCLKLAKSHLYVASSHHICLLNAKAYFTIGE